MLDISFEVNGRQIHLETMNSGLQKSILSTIRDALGERVGDICCESHSRHPKIICQGPSVVELSLQVQGCCDRIIYQVESRLQ